MGNKMNIAEHNTIYFRQIDGLPEESSIEIENLIAQLKLKLKQKPKRQAGCMKSLVVYIAEDFDSPLEDFKEYME
jgi:hypothetical protein